MLLCGMSTGTSITPAGVDVCMQSGLPILVLSMGPELIILHCVFDVQYILT